MEQAIKRINELMDRKRKINNTESKEIVNLLYDIYTKNKDIEMLVDYFYKTYYKISGLFVNTYYFKLTMEEKKALIEGFIKDKKFKENFSNGSILKGFALLESISVKDIEDINNITLIKNLATLAGRNKKFNPSTCKRFLEFLNKRNDSFFKLNFTSLSKDEMRTIFRFICATIPDVTKVSYGEKIQAWADKNAFIMPKPKEDEKKSDITEKLEETESKTEAKVVSNTTEQLEKAKALTRTLVMANQEAQKLFDNFINKNVTILSLQNLLIQKDMEIEDLTEKLNEKTDSIVGLKQQINQMVEILKIHDNTIAELNERLKRAYDSDALRENQEIAAIKSGIASSVKLPYEDFMEHKDEVCNEDNYDAIKVNLNQVFRTLKRFGIEL